MKKNTIKDKEQGSRIMKRICAFISSVTVSYAIEGQEALLLPPEMDHVLADAKVLLKKSVSKKLHSVLVDDSANADNSVSGEFSPIAKGATGPKKKRSPTVMGSPTGIGSPIGIGSPTGVGSPRLSISPVKDSADLAENHTVKENKKRTHNKAQSTSSAKVDTQVSEILMPNQPGMPKAKQGRVTKKHVSRKRDSKILLNPLRNVQMANEQILDNQMVDQRIVNKQLSDEWQLASTFSDHLSYDDFSNGWRPYRLMTHLTNISLSTPYWGDFVLGGKVVAHSEVIRPHSRHEMLFPLNQSEPIDLKPLDLEAINSAVFNSVVSNSIAINSVSTDGNSLREKYATDSENSEPAVLNLDFSEDLVTLLNGGSLEVDSNPSVLTLAPNVNRKLLSNDAHTSSDFTLPTKVSLMACDSTLGNDIDSERQCTSEEFFKYVNSLPHICSLSIDD
jgi:hypothetical protein